MSASQHQHGQVGAASAAAKSLRSEEGGDRRGIPLGEDALHIVHSMVKGILGLAQLLTFVLVSL